ncbi:MAG: putative membrane protein [Oceanicoccus sp.]|jgi:uncharacterized membrane protein
MGVYILIAALVVIALIFLYISAKTLISRNWFMKWLRGSFGFLAVLGTALSGIVAFNLLHYSTVEEGQVIATLRFIEVSPQEFDVELVGRHKNNQFYRLEGDQWQLDVRLIKVAAWFDGDLPAYKLDRLSGRYLSLEQENQTNKNAYDLLGSQFVDTWPWIANKKWLGLVQAKYGSATYMPMANGAIYQVRLFHDGLDAQAVNEQAKQALNSW